MRYWQVIEHSDLIVQKTTLRVSSAPAAIRARCGAKAAKKYRGRASLLIYLNISDFGTHHSETVASFSDATAPAKDAFREIWVLWKDRAYAVWKDGRPGGET